ncbi:hypothetical protein LA345_38730 (plasmid) [Burkholderia vietnamiensis]|uniref:Uncharacterized protein n=1 Tax=Burkholderia vietnamiensis (strain G4 / LMG 22486) TaxID=269482 RepID=A4JWA9_BURVG|nr:hypothetical protein Bcep1808_7692 [Burkholderia vietnamiensis G4]MCB4349734.1 hypothetical protein [Burkholderia vietnamiensis]
MTIKVEVETLRMVMQLNRDAIDMKVPMLDEFKLHFMRNRRRILENFRLHGVGMSMAMDALSSDDGNDGLAELKAEVARYQGWVDDEIGKLDAMKEDLE